MRPPRCRRVALEELERELLEIYGDPDRATVCVCPGGPSSPRARAGACGVCFRPVLEELLERLRNHPLYAAQSRFVTRSGIDARPPSSSSPWPTRAGDGS